MIDVELDDDLFDRITSVMQAGHELSTLSIKRPNWITRSTAVVCGWRRSGRALPAPGPSWFLRG